MDTLYEYAGKMMQQSIGHYFELVEKTNNFTDFKIECFDTDYARQMILAGKSQEYIGLDAKQCLDAVERVSAIPFDIEKGVSAFVYENSRLHIQKLIDEAKLLTNDYSSIDAKSIKNCPYLLPLLHRGQPLRPVRRADETERGIIQQPRNFVPFYYSVFSGECRVAASGTCRRFKEINSSNRLERCRIFRESSVKGMERRTHFG